MNLGIKWSAAERLEQVQALANQLQRFAEEQIELSNTFSLPEFKIQAKQTAEDYERVSRWLNDILND